VSYFDCKSADSALLPPARFANAAAIPLAPDGTSLWTGTADGTPAIGPGSSPSQRAFQLKIRRPRVRPAAFAAVDVSVANDELRRDRIASPPREYSA